MYTFPVSCKQVYIGRERGKEGSKEGGSGREGGREGMNCSFCPNVTYWRNWPQSGGYNDILCLCGCSLQYIFCFFVGLEHPFQFSVKCTFVF